MRFEWDPEKNAKNMKNHGISFEEAATVFDDKNAIIEPDKLHSEDEERFCIIGYSNKRNCLFVIYCMRESEEVFRLITARKASKYQERRYWNEYGCN